MTPSLVTISNSTILAEPLPEVSSTVSEKMSLRSLLILTVLMCALHLRTTDCPPGGHIAGRAHIPHLMEPPLAVVRLISPAGILTASPGMMWRSKTGNNLSSVLQSLFNK